jgi:hypothetical protein
MIAISNLFFSIKKDLLLTFNFTQKFHRYGLFLMPRQKFEYRIFQNFHSYMELIFERQVNQPDEKLISSLRSGVHLT